MTERAFTSVLHQLHCLAESSDDRRQSDRQLLERFMQQHDESAFAVLMRRHGRLVLSAIRRVLREEADVEDAFQATFLVLLRKASSVRCQASLGSWLFGVAHRLALKARANALRRSRRDSEACSKRPVVEESADLSWREALGLLHEELDRLPDKYRLPLLLCYLQSKSREEAAAALNCTVNVIKWRLERGRKLLRTRLTRRGVTLSAALLAALVDAPAAQSVAPVVVQTTLNAARTGIYNSSVAALMKAAMPAVWMGKARLAIGVLLTVGLLAVGGGSVLIPQQAAPQSPPVPTQAKTKESVIIRGRVLDPDGKPVEGARLYSPHAEKKDLVVVQRGVTDAEGRFHFELSRADVRPAWDRALIAAADGYGVQWIALPGENSSAELRMRLVKDQAIQGRILSTEGKPVAGARVQVVSLKTRADDRLDGFLTAWQRKYGQAFANAPKHLNMPLGAVLPPVSTDKEGRFRIAGIGAERIVELRIQEAAIARASLCIVSRRGFDPARVNKTAFDNAGVNPRPPLLYGPTFDYVAETGRVIEGTIRAEDSGDPLPGFTVAYDIGWPFGDSIRSVSDKQGHFRLDGVPKGGNGLPRGRHWLEVEPPANSSWLRRTLAVESGGASQPLKVDVQARRGVIVAGRVIDRTTGKGAMSEVKFVPLPGNKFCGKFDASYLQPTAATDAEGRFRMTILPGPGVLMASARATEKTKSGRKVMPYKQAEFDAADRQRVPTGNDGDGIRSFTSADNTMRLLNEQNAVKYLDLAPDAGAECDLFVDRGKTMTIPLQDEEGKPLTGAIAAGVTDAWRIYDSVFTLAAAESSCTVYALDPRRPRRLIFHHPKRRLAATLIVRGDEKEPPVVRLVQAGTVTGRVLDQDGQPIADANITLAGGDLAARKFISKLESLTPSIRTGADGRFRIDGLVPDLRIALSIRRGRTYLFAPRNVWMSLKPGETRDVGDLRTQPAR